MPSNGLGSTFILTRDCEMIELNCPVCGHKLIAPESGAGKTGKCKFCGERIRIPALSDTPLDEPERLIPTTAFEPAVSDDRLIVKGVNGQLRLVDDRVIISRKGVLAFMVHGLAGDKEILISSISSIQFKAAGLFTRGYIQFAFVGSQEGKQGLFEAVKDENSVLFDVKQQPGFKAIKLAIEHRRAEISRPQHAPHSKFDELEKLASLRDKGILTEEEFRNQKRRILDS